MRRQSLVAARLLAPRTTVFRKPISPMLSPVPSSTVVLTQCRSASYQTLKRTSYIDGLIERFESNKVFVGNIPRVTREDELEAEFAKLGEVVNVRIHIEKMKQDPVIGWVTFQDEEAAAKAISTMNGTELHGNELSVEAAKERPRRKKRYRRKRER